MDAIQMNDELYAHEKVKPALIEYKRGIETKFKFGSSKSLSDCTTVYIKLDGYKRFELDETAMFHELRKSLIECEKIRNFDEDDWSLTIRIWKWDNMKKQRKGKLQYDNVACPKMDIWNWIKLHQIRNHCVTLIWKTGQTELSLKKKGNVF